MVRHRISHRKARMLAGRSRFGQGDAPARSVVRKAFKISYTVPDFDAHGHLNDYTVYQVETPEQALLWFNQTHHRASQATDIRCEEGEVLVSRFVLATGPNSKAQEWEVVGPFKN